MRSARPLLLVTLLLGCSAMEERICLGRTCPKQSKECRDYIACSALAMGSPAASFATTYGPMGTCWTSSYAALDACTSACVAGLSAIRGAYPDAGCP